MATEAIPLVRAGCYHRISSDPDDKRQGTQRQREDTAVLCEIQGWVPAGDYTDDNRSASNGKDRPAWKRLLADIAAGKIDAIAAWDQDRNWRMMSELEDLRRFFGSLDREVKLATTGQGVIDLFSPTGVLQAQLKTMMSEHEIATMRVRQLRAAKQRAERGVPKWKKAFGYVPDTRDKKHDDGTRQIDQAVKPLIVAAYEAIRSSDMTITGIARRWNDAAIYGLTGKPWSASTVSLFLRSPRNAGLRAHNGVIVGKGTWEPLVDKDLWEDVQMLLDGNRHGPKSVQKHLLTGVMRCGRTGCDGHLGGNWQKQSTGGQPGRLKAGAVRRPGETAWTLSYACKRCHRLAVRSEHVEPLLRGLLVERLSRPDAAKLLRSKTFNAAEDRKLRADERVLRARLALLGKDFGNAPPEFTQAALAEINGKLADIERRRQDQDRLRVLDGLPLGSPQVAAKIDALTPERYRAVFDLLASITVLPVGKGGHAFDPDRIDLAWR